MNGNDLIKGIGHTDDRYIAEALELESDPGRVVRFAPSAKKPKLKRVIIIAACLIVALSACTLALHTYDYAPSTVLEFIKGNPGSSKHTDLYFRPVGNVAAVSVRELKGDVKKLGSVIKSQYKNYPVYSSLSPSVCELEFDSTVAAEKYIGFYGLAFPAISGKPEPVTVTAEGTEKGLLTSVRMTANYKTAPGVSAVSTAMIFTENYSGDIGVFVTSYSDAFEGVDFTGGEKTVNGHVFYEVQSSPFDGEWLNSLVFGYENGVLYSLTVRFREADRAIAESVASEWMNSF